MLLLQQRSDQGSRCFPELFYAAIAALFAPGKPLFSIIPEK
jgi:hypothetical protein